MTRARRLSLAILLVLGIAATSWIRSDEPYVRDGDVIVTALELPDTTEWPDTLELKGLWSISTRRTSFGGFSSLLALPGGNLLAFSDRGMQIAMRETAGSVAVTGPPRFNPFRKSDRDVEAVTRDPATGTLWLSYETDNSLLRLQPDGNYRVLHPQSMRGWGVNSGAEAIVRLTDGRFVLLREVEGEALLFPGDPFEGIAPVAFRFEPPGDMNPTDMVQLPDGRVLILLRGLAVGFPPVGASLVMADPAEISEGEPWDWYPVANLTGPMPPENYEAIAVRPAADGTLDIWLMSDDNAAVFQRTLLARLRWTPDTKKGAAVRPGAPSG